MLVMVQTEVLAVVLEVNLVPEVILVEREILHQLLHLKVATVEMEFITQQIIIQLAAVVVQVLLVLLVLVDNLEMAVEEQPQPYQAHQ
jgi:hypothetical protein